MSTEYLSLKEVSGPLVVLEGVTNACSEEEVTFTMENGEERRGRVLALSGDRAVLQVFEGTSGMSLSGTRTRLSGHTMTLPVSRSMLGRVLSGVGVPRDGLGPIYTCEKRDVNGATLNPVSREYPRDYIATGFSAIDGLATLIRGQKLPIFSGSGLPHDRLALRIAEQASVPGSDYAIVFCAMGVKKSVADHFRRSFEADGALSRVCMFVNLSDDPVVERILCPRCALTAAEYLAFTLGMEVLVIMSDMTAYAEALREISASVGEIPGRKGYPGYLYSDLASLYERAGRVKGKPGSLTEIPILTMPGDDITHPVPDLTGFITEGQIVLDRTLHKRGIFPPVSVLLSLSRLMKDGIGKDYTREDHGALSGQLFASYAKVQDVRSLAGVIGEDGLSDTDRAYLAFGKKFEEEFIGGGEKRGRSIEETLNIGWELLRMLPRSELDRLPTALLDKWLPEKPEAETVKAE